MVHSRSLVLLLQLAAVGSAQKYISATIGGTLVSWINPAYTGAPGGGGGAGVPKQTFTYQGNTITAPFTPTKTPVVVPHTPVPKPNPKPESKSPSPVPAPQPTHPSHKPKSTDQPPPFGAGGSKHSSHGGHSANHAESHRPKPTNKHSNDDSSPSKNDHHTSAGAQTGQTSNNPQHTSSGSSGSSGQDVNSSGQNQSPQKTSDNGGGSNSLAIGLGVGLTLAALLAVGIAAFFIIRRRKQNGYGSAESFNEEGKAGHQSIQSVSAMPVTSPYGANMEPTLPAVVAAPSPRNSYADPFADPVPSQPQPQMTQTSESWKPKTPSRLSQINETAVAEEPPQIPQLPASAKVPSQPPAGSSINRKPAPGSGS